MNLFTFVCIIILCTPKRFSIKQERINILRVLEHHVKTRIVNRSFSCPLIMGVVFVSAHLLEFTRSKDDFVRRHYCDRRSHRFPISYIINDCIAEVWGYRKARLIIWLGFLMNLMAVIFIQIAIILPSAPFWDGQKPFETVFSSTPDLIKVYSFL